MTKYVKISYKTQRTNEALKKCIEYIGKYYGKNQNNLYKSGKKVLAKKVKGASKTSVHKMVYSKKIRNSEMRQWEFKKRAYERLYRTIFKMMLQLDKNQDEAKRLLHDLCVEACRNNRDVNRTLSDTVVREQKKLLHFAIDKPQYSVFQDEVKKILAEYEKCDATYNVDFI